MNETEKINKGLWAPQVFDYVTDYNTRNREMQVVCKPAISMHYIHLSFRRPEEVGDLLKDNLFIAVVHDKMYKISGHFSVRPIESLTVRSNKLIAKEIAQKFFNAPFSSTDEENTIHSEVTPRYKPHLVHRYFKYMQFNDLSSSELYFNPYEIENFSKNNLESELNRFMRIVEEVRGKQGF